MTLFKTVASSLLYIVLLLILLECEEISHKDAFGLLLGWCLVDYLIVMGTHLGKSK